ncbi:MAG: HEPN domain-containing protein [bacterium]|nr:MAG: HEPN domain-containing protein [bacterium]
MIDKEMASAEYDLKMAEESILKSDTKWASVQAYYSMFHSAKALVFTKGYREKSHYCLIVALRELYIKTKELEKDIGDNLENCMDIRHGADYGLTYDKESAKICIEAARNLFESAKLILNK